MHILSGSLRKPPFQKDLGADKGYMFVIELSEMTKDFNTQEKSYTNYKAILFAKTPSHIKYYIDNLIEGAFVVINCEKLKIERYQADPNSELRITLTMENARLENVSFNQTAAQQPQQQQQGGFAQQGQQQGGFAQPAPQQQGGFAQQPQQQQQGGFAQQPQQGGFSQQR